MQYFSEIFGMGYDSKKEKTLIKILILSSIFLSFASGFTTYLGLNVINLTEWLVSIVKTPAPIIKVPQVLSSRPYRFNSFYHYLLDIGYQPGHSL